MAWTSETRGAGRGGTSYQLAGCSRIFCSHVQRIDIWEKSNSEVSGTYAILQGDASALPTVSRKELQALD